MVGTSCSKLEPKRLRVNPHKQVLEDNAHLRPSRNSYETLCFLGPAGLATPKTEANLVRAEPAISTHVFYVADFYIAIQTVDSYHTDVDIVIQTVIQTIVIYHTAVQTVQY